MSFTMAVIADTHLPAMAGTAQEACLDWALQTLAADPPDLVAVAGDVTAAGAPEAAVAFRSKLDHSRLPCRLIPGNSDLRNPAGQAAVLQALAGPPVADHPACRVVMLDTGDGEISSDTRRMAEQATAGAGDRALVIVMHFPPEVLAPDSRQWCEAWVRQARPSLIVAAHSHRDRVYDWAGVPVQMVRGLDPDKAIGGPPAVSLFTLQDGRWRRRDLSFPDGTAAGWSVAEREELGALLGLGCSRDAAAGLRRAAAEGAVHVELRAKTSATEPEALREALTQWRAAGGRYLSWHMPDVPWHEEGEDAAAVAAWRELLALGLRCDLQAVTVHVPRVPVRVMPPGSAAWRSVADMYCRLLAPAAARGARLCIENMHMHAREAPDDTRRYGYLPDECLAWVAELRQRLGGETVAALLDLGHARNNSRFAGEFTLGAWYALIGREVGGYHVHQVVATEAGMANHQPLTGLYGPLISLSSFLWAWHVGQLNHAPVFLEITDPEGQTESLRAVRRGLGL